MNETHFRFHSYLDIQDCLPNPCGNGGKCTDEGLTYSCDCTGDWVGDQCTDSEFIKTNILRLSADKFFPLNLYN